MCVGASNRVPHKGSQFPSWKQEININWDHHDPCCYRDPLAKKSKRYSKGSKREIVGDGDVWIENIATNSKSKRLYSVFISRETGKRIPFEPPTGASKVVFLQHDIIKDLQDTRNYQICRLRCN
jgi:hypothetical protein